ncbi:MAG TPA: hypothetical protein VFX98_17095, partial [Longimicrobiaceae bacterium]|nr:hypothetical protein [Longimicrobiaceae bacterium]
MDRRRLALALAVLAFPVLLWGATRLAAPGGTSRGEAQARPAPRAVAPVGPEAQVPREVQRLLEEGRHWRAARRLRELTNPRSDPGLLVVAAKA